MNKVILMGRLTRDPEIRYSQGNDQMAIARYTLAVDRRFNRNGDQTADFINCVAFGRSAEFAESKGSSSSDGGSYQPAGRPSPANASAEGFMSIPEGIEDDLPFK